MKDGQVSAMATMPMLGVAEQTCREVLMGFLDVRTGTEERVSSGRPLLVVEAAILAE